MFSHVISIVFVFWDQCFSDTFKVLTFQWKMQSRNFINGEICWLLPLYHIADKGFLEMTSSCTVSWLSHLIAHLLGFSVTQFPAHSFCVVLCRISQQGSPRAPLQTEQPVRKSSITVSGRNTVWKSTLSCRLLCCNPYSLSLAPLVYFGSLSVQQADRI